MTTPTNQWTIAGTPVPKVGGRDFVNGKKLESHSPTTKHLNLSRLSGWEGGPCPRPSLNASQQQISDSNLSATFEAKLDHELSAVFLE